MVNVIIENLVSVLGAALIALIGVLGTWLTTKIGKKQEIANINLAMDEVIKMAQTTCGELQQTVVTGLKEASADGRLTSDEIANLGNLLIDKTAEKMSTPTFNLLNSAGVDITALITGAAEDWINSQKQ